MSNLRPTVVIDNGTGYTKMGYAGNYEPQYIIPSTIANKILRPGEKSSDCHDLEFFVGKDALVKRNNYNIDYPIRHGIIDNWDNMEKYWQRCMYQYLMCDPEDHFVLLTEPPLNTPENREYTAEIMFETFNVPGLYIAVQAVLALCASILNTAKSGQSNQVTGTVIDSGDGVTHIIPVVEGYVIGSCIKHIPLAGRDVTNFMMQMLRERGEKLPPHDALNIVKRIKERYCYVCPDIVKEFKKYDKEASKFREHTEKNTKTGKEFKIDVGYERFLAPELFFNPQIFSTNWTTPLPEVVDATIQACPIDTRRPLYKNISLSGGSTMFKFLKNRLSRDINKLVKARHQARVEKFGDKIKLTKTEVKVLTHDYQRFAVWFGGSMLASQPEFLQFFHTKADYQEKGPRVARSSPVFPSV